MTEPSPCYKCAERFDGCHGRDASGCWRCEKYRVFRERREAELAASSARIAAENDVRASRAIIRRRAELAADRS